MILTLVDENESFEPYGKHFKLLSGRITVKSFDVFVRVTHFLHKMISNLQENWIARGLFINTQTQLIHFNGKYVV